MKAVNIYNLQVIVSCFVPQTHAVASITQLEIVMCCWYHIR